MCHSNNFVEKVYIFRLSFLLIKVNKEAENVQCPTKVCECGLVSESPTSMHRVLGLSPSISYRVTSPLRRWRPEDQKFEVFLHLHY